MREALHIGLLRPPEVSASSSFRRLLIEQVDDDDLTESLLCDEEIPYDETLDKMIAEFRELFLDAANDCDMNIVVDEYQLHDLQHDTMGRKRRRKFLESDIVSALDPTSAQCALMAKAKKPVQRIAVGFKKVDNLIEQGRYFSAAGKLPVFSSHNEGTRKAISRAFLFQVSPHEDERASTYQNRKDLIKHALNYPFVPSFTIDQDHDSALWTPPDSFS